MTARFIKFFLTITLSILPFFFAHSVLAAAPDGMGPWADSVVSFHQGLMKNGLAVPLIRSDPTSGLGVAEGTNAEGTFVALGFGGVITLGFDNGISGGAVVVEATNAGYPDEHAKIEMSADGVTWVTAGNLTNTGTVSQPEGIACAKFVRITDTSNPSAFSDATADGYDVDGVKALGDNCTPTVVGNCNCNCPTDIKQTNTSSIFNSVFASSKTGGNHSNGNTSGDTSITTGGATTTVSISNSGNTNTVSSGGGSCCKGTDNNISISGNGAGSTNSVVVSNNKKHKHW